MSERRCQLCGRPLTGEKVCACGNAVRAFHVSRAAGPNNKDRVRERGKVQRVKILEGSQGFGSCHWCGREVVCVASIPEKDRIGVSSSAVRWRLDGVERHGFVATTDHVVAVADGGKNGRNIVVSCAPCNQARKSEKAKALEAEAAQNNNAARKQLHWLLKVDASVAFGKPTIVEVRCEGEVVVSVTNDSFDAAVNEARETYGRWHVARFGKAGGGDVPRG